MPRAEKIAVIETGLAIALWAVSFVFIKIALRQVSPATLITWRFAVASLILAGVAVVRGEFAQFERADLGRMAIVGLVGIAIQQWLQVSGQVGAEAAVAAFLASTAPAFLVAMAGIFLHEKLGRWQVLGVLLATVGAGLVSSGGNLAGLASGQLMKWGNFLVLLSAWVWAVFTIINRRLAGKRPAVMMTAGMMFFGGMFTLPWFVVQRGWEEFATLNTTTWGALLYIGILSTAGSYLLYTHALTLTEASKIAAIQNIEPLIAMLAAAFIVAEPITGTLVLGGAAIVVGVTLAERAGPERAQDYRLPD